jgi:hypothetical protein
MLKKVFAYAVGFVAAPRRSVKAIAADPDARWLGLWLALIFLIAYSVTVFIFWLLGHQPVTQGWLPISPDKWYLVQTFTTIPIGLAGFLSFAALLYLLCSALGGRGSFDATLAVSTYCAIVPCIVLMLLLELLVAPIAILFGMKAVPWPEWVEILRTFVLPFAWIFALSSLALKKVHGTHPLVGLAFTVLAMIPTGIIMAVFIR